MKMDDCKSSHNFGSLGKEERALIFLEDDDEDEEEDDCKSSHKLGDLEMRGKES